MTNPRLFGTGGIRGDAEKLFTNQFCFDIGRSFIRFLSQKEVKNKIIAFGMDSRPSSIRIKKAVMSGIKSGRQISDEGIIPTPALNYFTQQKNCAGIMVTGSHIDVELNGLKFFVNEKEFNKSDEKIMEQIYSEEKEKIPYKLKTVDFRINSEAQKLYVKMLVNLAKADSQVKVVIDAGNGTQSKTVPEALENLGVKVVRINCDLNKTMLARDTETEDAFPELKNAVVREKANFGIGYDADGDRAIFVDENGFALNGEVSCSIIAKHSKELIIATPINTSSVVEHLGKKVIRTKVGASYVVEAMKQHGSKVGFESNGGYISGEIFYSRDGGSTTIKMLNLLIKTAKRLSELVAELPKYYTIKNKTDCPREINTLILTEVRKRYTKQKIEDLDGLKVWADSNSWVLFRPSGNAPEFRVFAEAKTDAKAKKLAKKGMALVKKVIEENKK